jgi:endonuclease/exonuclease/phosphatase family metal-dependent hydrolase
MKNKALSIPISALLLALLVPPLGAKSLAVQPDGNFDEWGKRKPRVTDPAGDGASGGLDLRRLWLADDGEALYLRLEVGRETLLQNPPSASVGNLLRLFLDTDAKQGTGITLGNLGVDLEIRFGEREIVSYDADGAASFETPGAGLVQALPTYSAETFEIRVQLPDTAANAGALSGKRRKVKLLLREETEGGDRLPNSGLLVYKLGKKVVAPPAPIDLAVAENSSLRVVSLNVRASTIAAIPDVYARFLQALDPDIVCLQELTEWSAQRARQFLAETLPGKQWSSARVNDVHTLSAFPILAAEAVDDNLVTHIGLPSRLGSRDLVIFNAHPPCCDNDAGREREIDHLMATWRELLAGGGPFAIDPEDAMVILGDFNLVGFRRQFVTLRDGVFADPANGPDFAPGRDQGSLREAPLRHTHRRLIHTWRNPRSEFSPGKLDFVLYTGDALELLESFVPDTEGMPADFLDDANLLRSDSPDMSDHLSLVVDFATLD